MFVRHLAPGEHIPGLLVQRHMAPGEPTPGLLVGRALGLLSLWGWRIPLTEGTGEIGGTDG